MLISLKRTSNSVSSAAVIENNITLTKPQKHC